MNLKKLGTIAGALLVSGALVTGAAFAAEDPNAAAPTEKAEKAPWAANLTEGEKSVLEQLQALRKAAMEKLNADSKSLVDEAVQNGTITQEQADRMLQRGGKFKFMSGKGFEFKVRTPLTQEELKARLDAAVADGKLTQEQADEILANGGMHFGRGGHGMKGMKGMRGMRGQGQGL